MGAPKTQPDVELRRGSGSIDAWLARFTSTPSACSFDSAHGPQVSLISTGTAPPVQSFNLLNSSWLTPRLCSGCQVLQRSGRLCTGACGTGACGDTDWRGHRTYVEDRAVFAGPINSITPLHVFPTSQQYKLHNDHAQHCHCPGTLVGAGAGVGSSEPEPPRVFFAVVP